MEADQKDARLFGVLFIMTFLTSIPAYLLFQSVTDDPAGYIAGSGNDNQIYLAAFLEFALIIANVGTAVVLYPIARRQSKVLALGYVAARIIECVFLAAGIIFVLGVLSLRQVSPDAADLAVSLGSLKEWTFLFGPGFVVPFGNGLILGYLMYKSGLVPRRMTWFGMIGGAHPPDREHPHARRRVGRRERASSPPGRPGVHLGGLPRHLLHDLGLPARTHRSFRLRRLHFKLPDTSGRWTAGASSVCRRSSPRTRRYSPAAGPPRARSQLARPSIRRAGR